MHENQKLKNPYTLFDLNKWKITLTILWSVYWRLIIVMVCCVPFTPIIDELSLFFWYSVGVEDLSNEMCRQSLSVVILIIANYFIRHKIFYRLEYNKLTRIWSSDKEIAPKTYSWQYFLKYLISFVIKTLLVFATTAMIESYMNLSLMWMGLLIIFLYLLLPILIDHLFLFHSGFWGVKFQYVQKDKKANQEKT